MKKKNKPAKPIVKNEITDLKEFLNKKFSGIDERFSSIDNRFSGMEKRFDGLENRMEEGFKEIKTDLRETEERLNKRITNVGDLITVNLSKKDRNLEKRVAKLERTYQVA
ncbi:MAG: hypothetical protein Q7K55_04885 [Candidatus Levybacteria bacterium]|nr:hypothetical protein [Candidatus Levybacteria bacterium]